MHSPTQKQYGDLQQAYALFNDALFGGSLPECLITMQRQSHTYGYFAGERFGATDGSGHVDEIALNPAHFKDRSTEEVLSTLVHEMTHLWQHHFGQRRSQRAYHNKEWAAKMEAVGLAPSATGEPGGKKTGQRVSHYIEAGGAFAVACARLVEQGFVVPYADEWEEGGAAKTKRKKKAASKTKYTCASCGLNVWGKPEIKVVCGACMAMIGVTEQRYGKFHRDFWGF